MREKSLQQILGVSRLYPALWMLLLTASVTMPAQQNTLSTALTASGLNGGLDLPKVAKADMAVHNIPLSQSEDHYLHPIPLSKTTDHYVRQIPPVIAEKTRQTITISEKVQRPAN